MIKSFNEVLLVDDDQANTFLCESLLKSSKTAKKVIVAIDGQEAIDFIEKGLRPDLILLDIRMPVMDGFQFLEEFEKLNLPTPIIMLTSSAREEDRRKALAYPNVFDYLEKPLRKVHLASIAEHFL
jgi:CheY-like chemotaxis protein